MLKHYSTKQKAMVILNIALYLAFIYFVIVALLKDHSISGYVFVVLGIIALIIGTLNEYLKYLYNEALWYLNFKLDCDKAEELYNKMVKYDIFKIHSENRGLFDVMVALERKQPRKVIEIINQNDKKFTANVEMLLIKLYYEMRAYLSLGQTGKINNCYTDVKNIEKMKKKPKIFQYDELDAIHEVAIGHNGEAYNKFKNVNMRNMNPKEQKFILEQLIITAPNAEKAQYQELLNKLMEIVSESK
ncbi:MAG: hypothetical protein Q4B60_04880 [Erysipelotrichaceae bacterium]|nr:hypothetical protein [Erysipelotrichaceae bacterium]